MNGRLYHFFEQDHSRLDDLLAKATANSPQVDEALYHEFRTGLLKHIKLEEKIIFKAAQQANGGEALPLQAKLRLDHGALTSFMVVPPTPEVIKIIVELLKEHNRLEEEPGGMYDQCEQLTNLQVDELFMQIEAMEDVPVHPYNTADYALEAAKRSLTRAGFDFTDLLQR